VNGPHVFRWTKGGHWLLSVADAGAPRGRRVVDLGTADRDAAIVEAGKHGSSSVGVRAPETRAAVRGDTPARLVPPPAPIGAPPPPPPPRPGEETMRALFARDAAPAAATTASAVAPTPSVPPRDTVTELGAAAGTSADGRVTLDDGEVAKMAEMTAVIGVQLNTLLIGWGIKVFGRRSPDEPDEALERMNLKGWTAALRKIVGNREASAFGVILVSSVGMGLQMYAGGEPLPDEEKRPQLRAVDGAANATGDDEDDEVNAYRRKFRDVDDAAEESA
jgi:hypothetical protein